MDEQKTKTIRITPKNRGEHQITKVDGYLSKGYKVKIIYTDNEGNEIERDEFYPFPFSQVIVIDFDQHGNEVERTPLNLAPEFGKLSIIQRDLKGKIIFKFEREQKIK